MRYIVLDTETTGFDVQNSDRIVEFAGVEMLKQELSGRSLHFYFNPERKMDKGVIKIHGITDEFLKDKNLFKEHAKQIIDFLKGATLIIHNAKFDVDALNNELKISGFSERIETICAGVIDTLEMAKMEFPGQRNNLNALCDRLGINRVERNEFHGALIDCKLLAEVYIKMSLKNIELKLNSDHKIESKFSQFDDLLVLEASEDELNSHNEYLYKLKNIEIW